MELLVVEDEPVVVVEGRGKGAARTE